MGDKKHIDRLFQERLKDFEVFPNAEVWKNIEEQLVKKKKRRIFPLWLRLGSAAAILLMLLSTGFWYYNAVKHIPKLPDSNTIITDVDADKQQNDLEKTIQFPSDKDEQRDAKKIKKTIIIPVQEETLQLKSKNTSRFAKASGKQQVDKVTSKTQLATTVKEEVSIAKAEIKKDAVFTNDSNDAIAQSKKIETTSIDKETTESIAKKATIVASNVKTKEALKNDGKKDISKILKEDEKSVALAEKIPNNNKWSMGSMVAPVFFNTLKDGSPIHSSLASNEKTSKPSLSYGLKVNYKINDRLSLQSGINSLDLAYQTKNVSALITSSNGLSNDTNINTNVQGIKIVTVSTNTNDVVQSQELTASRQNGNFINLNGDLNQSFSYIEIPLEAKYNLLQRKIGVHLIGGMSTYLLYENGISIENQQGSTTLGEGSNINDVNFSGNVGLDFDYKITKKLYMNVSPMFKYQLNTFSKDDGGFKPYTLGVYTGLNFRF